MDNEPEDDGMREEVDEVFLEPDDVEEEIKLEAPTSDADAEMQLQEEGSSRTSDKDPTSVVVGGAICNAIGCLSAHSDSVYCVAVHPRLPLACSGGGDDQAIVWDYHSGQKMLSLDAHSDTVVDCAFGKGGDLLATASMDGTVKIWDSNTGEALHSFEGPEDGFEWVDWHPQGVMLCAGDASGSTWMWNGLTGECKAVMAGHSRSVTCGMFTLDGSRVVTGSEDGSARVWNVSVPHAPPLFSLGGHKEGITACCCSHNNSLVALACQDCSVSISNLNNGKQLCLLKGFGGSVESVDFCRTLCSAPDSCVTGSLDGIVRIWDIGTQNERQCCDHEAGVLKVCSHPFEPLLLSCSLDHTLRLWDVRSCSPIKVLTGHTGAVFSFALSSDGRSIISASDDGRLFVYSVL